MRIPEWEAQRQVSSDDNGAPNVFIEGSLSTSDSRLVTVTLERSHAQRLGFWLKWIMGSPILDYVM